MIETLYELLVDETGVLASMLWIVLWLPSFLCPLAIWIMAVVLAPPGEGARSRRAAGALGLAAVGVLVSVPLLRLITAVGGVSGGPAGWFAAWLPLSATAPEDWNLAVVVVLYAWLQLLVYLPIGVVGVVMHRARARARRESVPGAEGLAVVLALVAPLTVLLMGWALGKHSAAEPHALLDLAATAPVAIFSLAIWSLTQWAPKETPRRESTKEKDQNTDALDVVAIWRRIGAITDSSKAFLGRDGEVADERGSSTSQFAWRLAGGGAAPPRAIDELFEKFPDTEKGWLIPDLPEPTNQVFLTAALVLAIHEHGLPCLVVTEQPAALRDRVDSALQASGTWSCGPLVAGWRDLRASFAGGYLPAAVFLDVAELSREGIRELVGDLEGVGTAWCRTVGLLVISRLDRGTPLEATHRLFTLQRLGLALQAAEARWSVLATGFGGERSLALLERAYPGFETHQVRLGPRARAPVRVWLADHEFRTKPGHVWVREAVEPVAKAKRRVSVGDPTGSFGKRAVQVWNEDLSLVRDITLDGRASASDLDEAWLVASYRALENRVPLTDNEPHDALWGLSRNPVVGFLTRDRNLEGLHKNRMLLPPRPLVGTENRLVARTHLKAALRECQQDVGSLRDVFGDSLVDEVLGANFHARGHELRRKLGVRRLERRPLAPKRPDEEAPVLRGTVTDKIVRVKHKSSGNVLAEVDQVCAPTRYYTGRVFSVGAHRYVIPPQAYDVKREQILAESAPDTEPLTEPFLDIAASNPVVVEAPQRFVQGALTFQHATFEVTVLEKVSGYVRTNGAEQHFQSPVTAQYRTRARGIFFNGAGAAGSLYHLARSLDGVLVAQLFARDADIEVIPAPQGFHPDFHTGVLAVDRFVQGMGAAEAMSPTMLRESLRWVLAILGKCTCENGCAECTPAEVMRRGTPDKRGVLALLGHG